MTGTTHTHQRAITAAGARPCTGTGFAGGFGAVTVAMPWVDRSALATITSKQSNPSARRQGMPPT